MNKEYAFIQARFNERIDQYVTYLESRENTQHGLITEGKKDGLLVAKSALELVLQEVLGGMQG